MTPLSSVRRRLRAVSYAVAGAVAVGCAGHTSLAGGDGVLRPCPDSPNCVSSEAADSAHRVPTVAFTDAPDSAQRRARAALLAEPRTRVATDRPGYLHAESRSRVFRFVDDIEIVVDGAAHVFRFRSAARLGRNDTGVNRARVERVSARLRAPA